MPDSPKLSSTATKRWGVADGPRGKRPHSPKPQTLVLFGTDHTARTGHAFNRAASSAA